ncbi:MAG: HlyC/CorC family transporter [Phycisphaerales bacterium]|nr:MAG: HlyC/CorC family transporter [Phycisphaerales bacterium]
MVETLGQIGRFLLMALFLCGSAYCSGTETAFFSLSRRQVKSLRESRRRLRRLVADLLDRPSDLLGSLLLGNLIVNTLFFATSSVLMLKVEQQAGVPVAAVVALSTFLTLVLFGEILPKSVSYANPERFSTLAAAPTVILVRILSPVVALFRLVVAEPALRVLLGPRRHPKSVTGNEFKALVDATRERGLITAHQGRLFSEVVDFSLLKVSHVMRPRVDMVACDISKSPAKMRKRMLDHCLTTLYVYDGSPDNVLGKVDIRDLLLQPRRSLREVMRPVQFVPEQKTVEALLQFLRKMRTDTAAVVDEFGGVSGSVSIEDVAEELFGPLQSDEAAEPVEQLGPSQYRLSGNLPIHDWIKTFGVSPAQSDITTVGGWVTALLGRIPKAGDTTHWKNLQFKVERMQRHRVRTVMLTIVNHDT